MFSLLRGMRAVASTQISVTGAIPVTVTADKHKAYTTPPSRITVTVDWSTWAFPGPFRLIIEWGDGRVTDLASMIGKTVTPTPIDYTNPGSYTIKATIIDLITAATGSGSDTVSVAAPLTTGLSAWSPTTGAEITGGPIPLAVTFKTPITGGFPRYACSLDFGDGTGLATYDALAGTVVWPPHTYNKTGNFTATVTVTDSLGASMFAQMTVASGQPTPTPLPLCPLPMRTVYQASVKLGLANVQKGIENLADQRECSLV